MTFFLQWGCEEAMIELRRGVSTTKRVYRNRAQSVSDRITEDGNLAWRNARTGRAMKGGHDSSDPSKIDETGVQTAIPDSRPDRT